MNHFKTKDHPCDSTGQTNNVRLRRLGIDTYKEAVIYICEAQAGFREPARSDFTHVVTAASKGVVTAIDNRKLARAAKLTGAPRAKAAGLELHVPISTTVEAEQPLYTLHAETAGELDYALEYVKNSDGIINIEGI